MLEAIAVDEDLKATQRLRALEELGRMDFRAGQQGASEKADEEMAPDPMADLDEVEQARLKRSRRRAAAG